MGVYVDKFKSLDIDCASVIILLEEFPTAFEDPELSKLCEDTKEMLMLSDCYKKENIEALQGLLTSVSRYVNERLEQNRSRDRVCVTEKVVYDNISTTTSDSN